MEERKWAYTIHSINICFPQGRPRFGLPFPILKQYWGVPCLRALIPIAPTKSVAVGGYIFQYLQDLIPACDPNGRVIKYYPQDQYDNKNGLALLYHGKGAFCRFSITAGPWSGVYLWIADGQIIYIGETINLVQRFNQNYGIISPRNCYVGGQSTNCKMNKVVLEYFERGKGIHLYFYPTKDYKRVERELLSKMRTPYNAKNN